jgi:hypothetical protein
VISITRKESNDSFLVSLANLKRKVYWYHKYREKGEREGKIGKKGPDEGGDRESKEPN